jgi:hypothetical protein
VKFVWLGFLCIVFFCGTGFTNPQDGSGDFHFSRKRGIDLTVSIQVAKGRIQKISYSEWTPVNRSAHECGFDASRGDDDSKWIDRGNTITITNDDDDYTMITITTRADGLVVQSRCDPDLKVLFVWRDGKYVGRIMP